MTMDPCLFILVRQDLDFHIYPGKMAAQVSHATSLFEKIEGRTFLYDSQWNGDRGFGTTIVLGVSGEKQLEDIVLMAEDLGLYSGLVNDPSFPVIIGSYRTTVPLLTCGFIYGDREDSCLKRLTSDLSLF